MKNKNILIFSLLILLLLGNHTVTPIGVEMATQTEYSHEIEILNTLKTIASTLTKQQKGIISLIITPIVINTAMNLINRLFFAPRVKSATPEEKIRLQLAALKELSQCYNTGNKEESEKLQNLRDKCADSFLNYLHQTKQEKNKLLQEIGK